MKKFALTIVFISLSSLAGFSQTALRVGSSVPNFSAESMNGDRYDLKEMRGSVVVLTFWSSRCYICQVEFPKLNQVVRNYGGKKVVFLSLTMENEAIVNSFIRSNPIATPVVPNSFGVLLQYADRDRRGNLNMGFPAYFVIDKHGILQHRSSGWDKTDQLSSTISTLIH